MAQLVKNPPANEGAARNTASGRSPGEGNGNPLQCSCLRNPMDREAWWATVHEVTESDLTECTHTHTHTHTHTVRINTENLMTYKDGYVEGGINM